MSQIILPGDGIENIKKRSKMQKAHIKIEQLERELNSAKCLLWAAIKTTGGRVDIPKETMMMLNGDNELESHYDPKEETTIIQAKMKGQK